MATPPSASDSYVMPAGRPSRIDGPPFGPGSAGQAKTRAGDEPSSVLLAEQAAWERFCEASEAVLERRAAFEAFPGDLTAEGVRWAEDELEDAVAIAGEFRVFGLPWTLA
jgi:hypothetical protein